MAKESIRIFQMDDSLSGIEIYKVSDRVLSELELKLESEIANPHRHDHYCCFFVTGGVMKLNVDFQQVAILPASLLVSYPGQVHQHGIAADMEGWALIFDAKLIDENARTVIEHSIASIALLRLDDEQTEWFTNIFTVLESSLKEKRPVSFQLQLVQSLINSFFYKVADIFQQQENERFQEYSSRNIAIAKKFRQLVREHFLTLKKPSEYAEKMNITVSYLNDTVKSVTGFSSTYFIHQEILGEAQRLLVFTPLSIKETAFRLGYQDHKYFTRLFGKLTGITPSRFRESHAPAKQLSDKDRTIIGRTIFGRD